jgi:hypothetical protein
MHLPSLPNSQNEIKWRMIGRDRCGCKDKAQMMKVLWATDEKRVMKCME